MAEDSAQQRLFENGWESLSNLEVLSLALGPGLSPQKAAHTARRLLEARGSLPKLAEASRTELSSAGLSPARALALKAAFYLGQRLARPQLQEGQVFRTSVEVFGYFRPRFQGQFKEAVVSVLLDGKNRVLGIDRISEGCLTSSLVHPREVFRPAIRAAAAALLLVHNHPSGDPCPSSEDIQITHRLVATGNILGIRVLDHVIIGFHRYFSFADQQLIKPNSGSSLVSFAD